MEQRERQYSDQNRSIRRREEQQYDRRRETSSYGGGDRRREGRDSSDRGYSSRDAQRDQRDQRDHHQSSAKYSSSSRFLLEPSEFGAASTSFQKDAFAAPLSEEERGRPRTLKPDEKTRWGSEQERINIPGLPTSLPSDLSNDQIENYIIHMRFGYVLTGDRIEELGRKIRIGDYIPISKTSVSPPPTYGEDGKRNNTRPLRYLKRVEEERHSLVELGMRTLLGFRPPADYKRPAKLTEKHYIPQNDFPDINFIGLLIGPRGNTLKKMESETGTKISIRGKGSVKEGKNSNQAGDDEDLHAIIQGDTEDRVRACIAMINKIIETGQNELKRNQLRELAALNGTLRDDENQLCANCGGVGHRRFECPEVQNFTATLVCRICGGVGHIARDCLQKNDPAALQAASSRDQRMDEEYNTLMAELGGGKTAIAPAPWLVPDNTPLAWEMGGGLGFSDLGTWQGVEGAQAPALPAPPMFVPAPPTLPAPPKKE